MHLRTGRSIGVTFDRSYFEDELINLSKIYKFPVLHALLNYKNKRKKDIKIEQKIQFSLAEHL